ncbi:hypothetical protein AB3S75_022321 [Citrus x aurantiifolia]
MQLNRPPISDPTMTSEAPGPSGQWIKLESSYVVPNTVKDLHTNVSVRTGEEFSMEFLQDRTAARGIPAMTNTVQNNEMMVEQHYNQNNQMRYEDLARILGLKRMDSESASDISDIGSTKGSLKEMENGAYGDKVSRYRKEDADSKHGERKAFGELNGDRAAGLVSTSPPTHVIEPSCSSNFNGPRVLGRSQSGKMKFLCSFGGKILPRPSDGKLRYVGGETRIISLRTNLSWEELVKKTSNICNQPHLIKYQLPGEDLDALISVSSDDDLQNMIDEYCGLERLEGSQRLRLFLIPLSESENTASLEANTIQPNSPDYEYVVAVNGMLGSSPRKSAGGQTLGNETSRIGTILDLNPSFQKLAPTSVVPLEVKGGLNAFHPTQFINESSDTTRHPNQLHGNNSSIESGSSFITAQLPPEDAGTNTANFNYPPQEPVTLTNYLQPYKQIDNKQPDQPHGVQFLYCNSIEGMPHAFSDSKLQEYGGTSAYCSVEGVSPSSPLIFAKTQLPLLPVTNASPEMPMQLLENVKPLDPRVPELLLDIDMTASQGNMLHSPCPEFASRNGPICKVVSNINEKSQTAKDDVSKSSFMKPVPSGGNSTTSKTMDQVDERVLFLHEGGNFYAEQLPATNMEYRKNLPNINSNQTVASGDNTNAQDMRFSRDMLSASTVIHPRPCINTLMEHPKSNELGKTPSDCLVRGQTVYNQHCESSSTVVGGQKCNASWTKNSDVAGPFPNTREGSGDENSLADLTSGSCNGLASQEPVHMQPVVNQTNADLREAKLIVSADSSPSPVQNDAVPSSHLPKGDLDAKLQNLTADVALKREVSPLDNDFLNCSDKMAEKLGFGESVSKKSNVEDVAYIQTPSIIQNKDQNKQEPLVIVGDVTGSMPSEHQFSPEVVSHLDATSSDVMSTNETESDSIFPESLSQDSKADVRDKDESFSDAMIAEMEASIYGLQIIKNVDLEELRELGSGTYGTVYHGKWRGSDVAIKRIKKSCFAGRSSEQERLTKDFWREAHILSNLHHPNVVAFYGVVPDGTGGTLATVTEFMVNGSLKHVLLKKDRSLDRRKKLIIAMDAAFGMEYLHSKNIVHFDLKCENLLVNLRDPQRPICKVGDFGLSRIKRNTLVSGGVRGTLPWMAPELLNGSSNRVSEKVDVFSFGISMWEILTGEEPYADMHCGAIIGGIVKNTLRPTIPERCDPEWRKLMEQCWAADPEARPSFTEITSRLRTISAAIQSKCINSEPKQTKPIVSA